MVAHGLLGEEEVRGDLVVAESPGQMLEHLVLAVAELGEELARGGGWAGRVGGDAPQASASLGRFAYQPLGDSVFAPGGFVVLTQPAVVGAAVAVVGLIGLAGVVGFVLGRRGRLVK